MFPETRSTPATPDLTDSDPTQGLRLVRDRDRRPRRPRLPTGTRGIDAIAKAGHFLVALEELGRCLAQGPAHPLLGTGTVHACVIHGGEEPSTYPAHCRITLERRTVPGESADSVERELTDLLDRLADTVPDFRYRLTPGLHREPLEADPEALVVRTLTRHAEQALGHPAAVRAEPFWTDCALLDRAASPACSSASTARAPTRPPSTSAWPRWSASPASSRAPSPTSVPEPCLTRRSATGPSPRGRRSSGSSEPPSPRDSEGEHSL
ncbi:peptidase dimerization domain-containing protein [Streptomyces carpinensis]|uniref:Peptidase dimerization domain-containing protein n=1 Tax=Streptomyces carpinensis TaxID=66369 RepID=A0ABV1WG06_9ACTN|nr:peptidase dimerization domain-containing protein [Streptomyces carpinensis]